MKNKKCIQKGVKKILALTLATTMVLGAYSFSASASGGITDYNEEEGVKERFKIAERLGVLEYMESDGYLYEGYAMSLSFYEMTELIEIIRYGDMDEILKRDQESIERVYVDLESQLSQGIELVESYYVSSYSLVNHSSNGFLAGKYMGYTPAGVVDLFCGNNALSSPPAGTALADITLVTNVDVRKALYYGYNGPGAIESASIDFYIETGNSISEYLYGNGYSQTEGFRETISHMDPPPSGFTAYISTTNGGATQPLLFSMYEPQGTLSLKKVSSIPSFTNGSMCYSLEGAVYGVYDTKNGTTLSGKIGELTTDKDGMSNELTLDTGVYYVKEIAAPSGYILADTIHMVNVTSEKLTALTVENMPYYDTSGMVLNKVDAETGLAQSNANAELGYAQFVVEFYNTHGSINGLTPSRSWVFETDAEGRVEYNDNYKISGDSLYYNGDTAYLPMGTITVEEIKAPIGYLLNETVYTRTIALNEVGNEVEVGNIPIINEQIVRGDIDLIKVEEKTMKRMEGIPFQITSVTTGESHTIITDENGYASTHSEWNPHNQNTNRGETDKDGVWFGNTAVDNQVGALPYDSYIIEELLCENNLEHEIFPPFIIHISRDNYKVSLGTITNDSNLVPVTMDSIASDAVTGDQIATSTEKMNIQDSVILSGLTPGHTYTIQGVLMDKSSETEFLIFQEDRQEEDEVPYLLKKIELTLGEPVMSEYNFIAESPWEEHTLDFMFVGGVIEESFDIVVFEYLYHEEELLAQHIDFDDMDQTVKIVPPPIEEVLSGSIDMEEEVILEEEILEEEIDEIQTDIPKTGDETQLMVLILLLFLSLFFGLFIFISKEDEV